MVIRTVQSVESQTTLAKSITDSVANLLELGFVSGSDGDGTVEPIVLPYTRVARRNPFQKLLYCRSWDNGFAPVPTNDPSALAADLWPGPMVCHFHWLPIWTAGKTEKCELDAAVDEFRHVLSAITAQGIQLLWTIHNVLPHDSKSPYHDQKIRQSLVDAGALVHIMNRSTLDEVELERVVPDRVFRTPLPGFEGAYPDFISRADARYELELRPSDFVFVLFGRLVPYKGLDELVQAFIELVDREPVGAQRAQLVVAGAMNKSEFSPDLAAKLAAHPRIHLHPKNVRDADTQVFLRSADAMVCPYRVSLNSAAAMLGHAFGLRVVCPRTSTFLEYEQTGLARYYDPDDVNGLRVAMEQTVAEAPGANGVSLPEWNAKMVSDSFFSQLRERLPSNS